MYIIHTLTCILRENDSLKTVCRGRVESTVILSTPESCLLKGSKSRVDPKSDPYVVLRT